MSDHGPARWGGSNTGKRSVRAGQSADTASDGDGGPDATDAAKALATERGIDISTVTGTGAEGRVTKEDVQAVVDEAEARLTAQSQTD